MGDVERGRGELSLQSLDLDPHLEAELRVEVRQRLVHQERLRLPDDRARERDPLPLAAGQLARAAVEQLVEPEQLRHLLHLLGAVGLVDLPHAQRVRDVVEHAQVRVERVALEHHRHVAAARRHVGDVALADEDSAGRRRLQASEQPQRGRLAAA